VHFQPTVARRRGRRSSDAVRTALAVAKVNRLPTTVGYNLAYVLVGVGVAGVAAVREQPVAVTAFVAGIMLVKGQASVADAIHDRGVDAANPTKSTVARAVDTIGRERVWTLFVVELVAGLALLGYAGLHTGDPFVLVVGAAAALLGFVYSYPPRLKERGLINHLVTTAVDVGAVVLPIPYLVAGGLSQRAALVGAVVFAYSLAYHLVHQAADAYFDRESEVDTFARTVGVRRTLVLAALSTAVATGVVVALGYLLAVVALAAATGTYVWLYSRVRGHSLRRKTAILSDRFSIAWVASVCNGALAASALRASTLGLAFP